MLNKHSHPLFFTALLCNALFSSACSILMVFNSTTVADWLGMQNSLTILAIGGGLSIFTIWLGYILIQGNITRLDAWAIAIGDLAWVVASAILLLGFASLFSQFGIKLISVIAFIVFIFASLQIRGITKQPASNK